MGSPLDQFTKIPPMAAANLRGDYPHEGSYARPPAGGVDHAGQRTGTSPSAIAGAGSSACHWRDRETGVVDQGHIGEGPAEAAQEEGVELHVLKTARGE